MIARGSTPHHTFLIPEFNDDITKIYVTYSQRNIEKVNKIFTSEDLHPINTEEFYGYELIVNLSQEDTLSFDFFGVPSKDSIEIQLRIFTRTNEAYVSYIIHECSGKLLHEGVIYE